MSLLSVEKINDEEEIIWQWDGNVRKDEEKAIKCINYDVVSTNEKLAELVLLAY